MSRFDVATGKSGCADTDERHIETEQEAEGTQDAEPWDTLGEHPLPEVEMMSDEPRLQIDEIGNVHEDEVHEQNRQSKNGGGCGLNVEA